MRIDRAAVEGLIRGVAEKKIDPESAARALLGIDSNISPAPQIAAPAALPSFANPSRLNSPPDPESMQSLVQRLGPPPPEIEEDWTRQIQSLAKSWHAAENRPLPPLTLADWFIDAENRVSLSPQITATANHASLPSPAIQPAIEPAQETASLAASKPTATQPKSRKTRRAKLPAIAGSIAAAALILLLVYATSRPTAPDDSSLSNQPATTPTRESRSPSPFDPGFIADPQLTTDEAADLQAGVMELAETTPPLAQPVAPQSLQPDFRFDNPLLSGFAIDTPQPSTADITAGQDASGPATQSASTPPLDRPANTETDWDAEAAGETGAQDAVTIAGQPVESATPRQAVTLPTLRPASPKGETAKDVAAENSTLIGVNLIRDAQWDFPTQANIEFASSKATAENGSGEQPACWLWTDATSGAQLATLEQIDQQIFFRWSEQAASNPLSRQIAAGRLRLTDSTGQSSTVFLRPHLRTSPLRLDATETDTRFSWPLEGPVIYQSPNLNLQATKPDTVDMSWIEPPDPTNIRKQIAILQLTPAGKPSPAIRCQIECKATTKLQMRLRYFAQLDSTFPWQAYSATQLTAALDQVTQLLERRTAELSQLENQYRNATTGERRSIRPLKENVEQSVTQFRLVLQKLQQLNILHSNVAATSHLQLTLTTDWPDGPQTILEIPLPDK